MGGDRYKRKIKMDSVSAHLFFVKLGDSPPEEWADAYNGGEQTKGVPAVSGIFDSGYTIIVVLFILLIIVGCACIIHY